MFWLIILAMALGAGLLRLWMRHDERSLFADFRAAAESGQWFLVHTGSWENWQYYQHRTLTFARLRSHRPANWWDYDLAMTFPDWCDYQAQVQTRPYPQPAPSSEYGANQQLAIWSPGTPYVPGTHSPVPGVLPGMTSHLTPAQVQMLNTQGATAVYTARNGGAT